MVYSKNQIINVTIEDIGVDGEGIGHIDGYTFFIKDAVIGDTVSAKIMKANKSYAYARLEKVLTPSPFRALPRCEIARQCGGCQIQAISYAKQLEYKQNKVRNNLKRIGGFDDKLLDWVMDGIVGMDEPWNYRNKAVYPVGYDKEGKLIAGFYAGRTHSIISGEDCYIGDEGNKEILEIILRHMEKFEIKAYDETTQEGEIRHILIRKGFNTGEWMVCIVINNQRLKEFIPGQGELVGALAEISGMTSISVNINSENTNVILGKDTYCIWGKPYITDTIRVRDMSKKDYPVIGKPLEFHISPQSFYQVNPVQTEKLYSLALQYANLTGTESVWDLYCGIGTISLFLAGNAGKIYGVEIVPQAIYDARDNAKRNGIENAKFFVGKAEEVLPQFYGTVEPVKYKDSSSPAADAEKNEAKNSDMRHPDVIVVDPPRKGCDEKCLSTMVQMDPDRIVYVSCDSATLARDLKYLCTNGYRIMKVRPVDMFPHTVHVETVVLLGWKDVDEYMYVDYEPDHHIVEQGKATYREVTEEKEKAILDAFKHFGML